MATSARVRRAKFASCLPSAFDYLRCWQGPVFFAFVIDVYSRMIVGWQLASQTRTDLVHERCGWCIPSVLLTITTTPPVRRRRQTSSSSIKSDAGSV
jgi:hypothetical protein